MNLLNNFLFVVPARSGSKRVKNKNVKLLKGKPLILYTFDLLKKLNNSKNVYVTSDNQKIISLSKKYRFNFIKRSKKLSNDNSKTEDVIISLIKKKKITYSI